VSTILPGAKLRNRTFGYLVLASTLAAGGCERSGAPDRPPAPTLRASQVAQPAGWADDLAMPSVEDLNPDPHILEFNLEARVTELEIMPGTKTVAWTYNGTLPGPMIKAQVGDRVIVHFKNSLPEETTIHWHGLRLRNEMDGTPNVSQEVIPPGGEFTYDYTLRDAGTFWYHPHYDSAAQVGRGLYGAMVVEDPADPKVFGDDLVLLLSDMSLDDNGRMLPPDSGGGFGDLFGREGSVLLVNGKVRPTLKVRAGKQQRWRIINAARARYYNIKLRNHRFVRLGGDDGLAARSEDVYALLVTPGERQDAVFTPADAPGSHNVLRWVPTERGYGSVFNRPSVNIMNIETVADAPVLPETIPTELRTIEPIDLANAVEKTLELTIAINPTVEMGINGVPYWSAKPMEANIGDTQIWRIVNHTDFAHPFHLHGYFFQVLDDKRVPEWKDTVNVPTNSELRLAVHFDRPGAWMLHCHILDHADVGMMNVLVVHDPKVKNSDLISRLLENTATGGRSSAFRLCGPPRRANANTSAVEPTGE
jgi:FtsP/CotA-like multicopper oxidase with cupredoxin domain